MGNVSSLHPEEWIISVVTSIRWEDLGRTLDTFGAATRGTPGAMPVISGLTCTTRLGGAQSGDEG